MKSNFYTSAFLFLFLLFYQSAFAQLPANCDGSATGPRIAIAGDSWSQFMADDESHNFFLASYGHADKSAISQTYETLIGCTTPVGLMDYAVSGSEARQWADETNYGYLQSLITALQVNPTIDHVLLSLGGNDILAGRSGGGWYKNMDADPWRSSVGLFDTVQMNIQYVMDQIWLAKPDMNIVISSYDYPNFNVNFLFCNFYACPKREDLSRDDNGNGEIDNDELVTDKELNLMMQSVEGIRAGMASGPNVSYANELGLMQYYYGNDDDSDDILPPFEVSLPSPVPPYTPGGNVDYPSDRSNFRWVGICGVGELAPADPIHLDADGYEYKIKHQMDNVFFEAFRNNSGEPMTTLWSDGANDGYVDVIGQTTNGSGIRMGDNGPFCCSGGATNDYRGILSFETSFLPDNAIVTGASIYMIRSSENDNPFEKGDRAPVMDIKKGHFGSSPGLEWTDGNEAVPADASNIGCFFGEALEDNDAIRIDVDESALTHFNLLGPTQFRMYFDTADWSVEYVNFYDGGGSQARLPPDVREAQYVPVYESRVVERVTYPDGTVLETELSRGDEVAQRDGMQYREKIKKLSRLDENTEIINYGILASPEHPGLSRHMSEAFGAPGNGTAPFLDLTYILALPMALSDFTAVARGQEALLNWETSSEENGRGFEIQRSVDGENWRPIGLVDAIGNSVDLINYSFIDKNPEQGINYYRLRLLDWDGKEDFSTIQSVVFKGGPELVEVFPNPFQDHLSIGFQLSSSEKVLVQIFDILGNLVVEETLSVEQGKHTHQLTDLSRLNAGTYVVQIFTRNGTHSTKISKK